MKSATFDPAVTERTALAESSLQYKRSISLRSRSCEITVAGFG